MFRRINQEQAQRIRTRLPYVDKDLGYWVEDSEITTALKRPGLPRPKFRDTPIPATSLVIDNALSIIDSDEDEWLAVLDNMLCDLCALATEPERVYSIAEIVESSDGQEMRARGVMHKRCFLQAAHWCPHLREGLLNNTMVAFSCSWDGFKTHSRLVSEEGDKTQEAIIAEYAIAIKHVQAEWPFSDRK